MLILTIPSASGHRYHDPACSGRRLFLTLTVLLTAAVIKRASAEDPDCTFGPTSCTCSHVAPSGNCYSPVGNTGGCVSTPCKASWSCDCLNPTHLCTRSACTRVVSIPNTATPPGADVRCHRINVERCIEAIIGPMGALKPLSMDNARAPVAVPLALPSTEKLLSPGAKCAFGEQCRPQGLVAPACVLKTCTPMGTCSNDMQKYCEHHYPGTRCCGDNSACANSQFERNTAFCSRTCSDFCLVTNNYWFPCAFRQGGAALTFHHWSVPSSKGSGHVQECPSAMA